MSWPIMTVRYWDHASDSFGCVNDCFGNSFKVQVKARTRQEAERKFLHWHKKERKGQGLPRIHSIG